MQTLSDPKPEKQLPKQKLPLLYRFFCWCSGARLYILKQCPSEFNKFYGIGVIVFLTGIMASLSGGYAIFTVFRKLEIAIAFGALWGFLIFSIDWYIVASLRKQQSKLKEFGMALPRFVLAILIAFVVSMPLKLKLFEREIEQQMVFDQQQSNIRYSELVAKEFADIERLENQNAALRDELARKERQRNQLFEMIIAEAEGMSPTQTPGKGPVYREKKMEYDKVDAELNQLRTINNKSIEENNEALKQLRYRRDQAQTIATNVTKQSDGFLARLQAMNSLTSSSSSIQWASWFIILLFITIESAPIIVKLLSGRGPYDDLLEAEEYIKQVEIRRDVVQVELTEDHHIDLHRLLEKERNDKLYEVEKDHIRNEAEVLSEINKLKIIKWKEEEIQKLTTAEDLLNPDDAPLEQTGEDKTTKLFVPEESPDLKDILEENDDDLLDDETQIAADKNNDTNSNTSLN
jgi:hypothetical protein